jgi:diaminohydroxyphosphoribosylaminopyrimidine deaminase/5-amino-6-(5-phosphoribosylamino)uracil reductase
MDDRDRTWMLEALALAERGRGSVEPNPLVGALVVSSKGNIGKGWHQRFGGAHAEANALEAAGPAAKGATLYVTLEPCCHYGKTPPCTDAVIRAGICRVVAAMYDPDPRMAGRGVEQLRAAGLPVEIGCCEQEARRLNAPYVKLKTVRQPYIHAKWAMTLDGKIATRTGESRWISNDEARRRTHALRGRMDAIIVGLQTVRADDPSLTARPSGPRVATRIVLDRFCQLSTWSKLATTAREAAVMIACSENAPLDRRRALAELGCEVVPFPSGEGKVSIGPLLDELGRRGMTNVLVEGGASVLGSFVDARALDEVHVFVAPTIFGGAAALSPAGGTGTPTLVEALRLARWVVEPAGDNLVIHGWFENDVGPRPARG